jgi:hypothetical protein
VIINKSLRPNVPEKLNLNIEINCGKYSRSKIVAKGEDVPLEDR